MHVPGIYMIKSNTHPERVYIGSAVDLKKRWWSHVSDLRLNRHSNSRLQNHYNKYGISDLSFCIVLYGCKKEDLLIYEQKYIDEYHPWFNICKIAGNRLGVKASESTREKLRQLRIGKTPWNKGIPRTDEIKRISSIVNSRPIYQFDKEMNFIREWPSTISASRALSLKPSNIGSVIAGRSKTAGGFIWVSKYNQKSVA